MLASLYIKNLAIVDKLEISFESGLNIITGETGSGKSLIIKAIHLLMGKRFSSEMLRTGKDILEIEGTFIENDTKTVIKRIYRKSGKSNSYINGNSVSQKMLNVTTRLLADMHGQHDYQNLLDPNMHLFYLDSFGAYSDKLIKLKLVYNQMIQSQIFSLA